MMKKSYIIFALILTNLLGQSFTLYKIKFKVLEQM